MKKKQKSVPPDIVVSSDERQEVYQRLIKRNDVRAQSSLPPLDIPRLYHEKIDQLLDQKYHAVLMPYLEAAYAKYPGNPGLAGRLKQHIDVMNLAAELAGIPKQNRRPVNFAKFMRLYFLPGGLPLKH